LVPDVHRGAQGSGLCSLVVPFWYGVGLKPVGKFRILNAAVLTTPDYLRHARDAEASHLDAVLKVNGAKALRLSHALQMLRKENGSDVDGVELKLNMGEEPQIWLDLSHRVTMEPDPKTYRLSALSPHQIDVLLETEDLQTLLDAAERVLAHRKVRRAWGLVESKPSPNAWNVAALVYVWVMGLVTGAAGLSVIAIYMKKLIF
jgi:hypothetical protein